MTTPWNRSARLFLPFLLLFLIQTVPRLWTDSITRDEAWFLTNGYCYWTQGEVRNQPTYLHTPFSHALQALPLLVMRLHPPPTGMDEENRAYVFCYLFNRDHVDEMFRWARGVTLLLGVLLGWLLFLAARSLGPHAPVFALSLWALDPTVLAWGPVIKADLPSAAFALLSVLLFLRVQRSTGPGPSFLAGVALGAAITVKLNLLCLCPALLLLELLDRSSWREVARRWSFLALGAMAWILVLYSPGFFRYGATWDPFLEYAARFRFPVLHRDHFGGYLLNGHMSRHGLWLFYLAAVFLKSNLPFLLLLLAGMVGAATLRLGIPRWVWIPTLVLSIPLFFVQQGSLRYLLGAQPFLILLAALTAQWLWGLGPPRIVRGALILLFLWDAGSVLSSFPGHFAYFNELVPRDRRMHLLGENEFDVGQDYKRLAKAAREGGWTHLKLASESMTDPALYGLRWSHWTPRDLAGPQSGWVYVTSAAFLQEAPFSYPSTYPIAMSWVRHTAPTTLVGDTLLVHVIPGVVQDKEDGPELDSMPYFKLGAPRLAPSVSPGGRP